MDKPSWKDAPEWANYLAMNSSHIWQWFESKPYVDDYEGIWELNDWNTKVEVAQTPDVDWKETLEKRQ